MFSAMRRILLIVILALASTPPSSAASLEKDVRGRWLGAWVVTTADTWSDCGPAATRNSVNGTLVRGRGRRFLPGEIAQVEKVDAGRTKVEIRLRLAEPVLSPWTDGPFTLYEEGVCRAELEIELGREAIKSRNMAGIDAHLTRLLERHSTTEEARRSARWNEREREEYPEDYDQTVREHAIWQAERTNAQVATRIDAVRGETARIADRLSNDPAYLDGFAHGVEEGRAAGYGACEQMLSVTLVPAPPPFHGQPPDASRMNQGRVDGRNLVVGLQLLGRLPACFVPVPDGEEPRQAQRR